MSPKPDYYAVLGVARDADDLTVKRAFRRLAVSWHPDRHPGEADATPRFQTLVSAWEVLGDPERRAAYDAGRAVPGIPVEPGAGWQELLGRLADGLFGEKGRTPRPGRDREYHVDVSFAEAARGASRVLSLPETVPCVPCAGRGFPLESLPQICERCAGLGEIRRRRTLRMAVEDCPDCAGRGYRVEEACASCGGSGDVERRSDVRIQVPPAVEDGARLRIRGAGEPGRRGGAPGDLWVKVHVAPHPALRRSGFDVLLERPAPVVRAIAGGWLTVPTVDGPRRLRLPPGTTDGTTLRMVGLGVSRPGGGAGDQLVTVRVEMPASLPPELSRRLEEALREAPPGTFAATEAFEAAHVTPALPAGAEDDASD